MSSFGKQVLAIGIGKVALDTLFKGPQGGPLAIAAGLGLIALSGLVSAVGKSASSSLSSIGSGGGISTTPASQPRAYTPTVAPGAATGGSAVTNIHKVQFELTGSTLRGVLDIETHRLGRVLGR